MERRMSRGLKHVRLAAGIAIAASGWSESATAQTINKNEWRYAVAPYMWASGLEGDVGVGPLSSSVDLTAGDVLRDLKFGMMGRGEARKGSYVLALDGIYAKLGASKAFAIRGDTGGLELTQRETIVNPMGGYTLGDGTWSVDLLLGMRYWNLSTSLDGPLVAAHGPHGDRHDRWTETDIRRRRTTSPSARASGTSPL
jgi:hypothetical protein